MSTSEYQSLLDSAVREFDSFSLVWRDELRYDEHAAELEQKLQPYLIEETRVDRWPGTQLFDVLATVRYYRVTDSSIEVLRWADDFRSWQSPRAPEDLAFYWQGTAKYWSVAHEEMAGVGET